MADKNRRQAAMTTGGFYYSAEGQVYHIYRMLPKQKVLPEILHK